MISSNLIERLRTTANLDMYGVHRDVEREAADRIEELEKRVEQASIAFRMIARELVSVGMVLKAFENGE